MYMIMFQLHGRLSWSKNIFFQQKSTVALRISTWECVSELTTNNAEPEGSSQGPANDKASRAQRDCHKLSSTSYQDHTNHHEHYKESRTEANRVWAVRDAPNISQPAKVATGASRAVVGFTRSPEPHPVTKALLPHDDKLKDTRYEGSAAYQNIYCGIFSYVYTVSTSGDYLHFLESKSRGYLWAAGSQSRALLGQSGI